MSKFTRFLKKIYLFPFCIIFADFSWIGGVAQAYEGKKASEQANQNAQSELALTKQMYDQSRSDFAPYMKGADQNMAAYRALTYGTPQTYTDANGQTQTALANYNPTESQGFQYTKDRTLADLTRQYQMMGRGNSTASMNAIGRTMGDLNAANEDQYYNRYSNQLLNLMKAGQGAAGSTTAEGNSYVGNSANAYDKSTNAAIMNANSMAAFGNSIGNTMTNNGNNVMKLASMYSGGGMGGK